MPWTAYENGVQCKLPRLDGKKKQYDLRGYFLNKEKQPLFVEAKKYTTPGAQKTDYEKFVANVYSHTAYNIKEDMDLGAEFMWITWHPFDQSRWTRLQDHDFVHDSVINNPGCLGLDDGVKAEDVIDVELCRTVASRLWLVVLHSRQEQLSLTARELKEVMTKLQREGN